MEACYIADLLLGWQDEGRARPRGTYRLFARMFGEQAKIRRKNEAQKVKHKNEARRSELSIAY